MQAHTWHLPFPQACCNYEEMVFHPAIECPLCHETLEPDRTLEDHLVGNHTHVETANFIASLHDEAEIRQTSAEGSR